MHDEEKLITDEEIIKYYGIFGTIYFIDKYTVKGFYIRKRANQLGIKFRSKARLLENRELVIRDYLGGSALKHIADDYGVDSSIVKKLLISCDISLRTISEVNITRSFNDCYFSTIDTHQKAYWLGFIYADGCVQNRNNSKVFSITLAAIDTYHTENLKLDLESNHALINDRGNKRFAITSTKFCEDLFSLGVWPRKSLYLNFPTEDQVSKEFQNSFVLGFFDGDGSIAIATKQKKWHISIIGTLDIVENINRIFVENDITPTKLILEKRKADGKLWMLMKCGSVVYTGRNTYDIRPNLENIYKYLYGDRDLHCLARKKERFEKLLYTRYGEDWKNIIFDPNFQLSAITQQNNLDKLWYV